MADTAHRLTDEKLEEMEKRLSAIYSRAEKEIQKTADEYFARFAKQDEAKRKLLEQGKITEDEYKKWRRGKVMYGKRFTEMKEQCAKQLLNVNQTALAYVNGELPEVYAINYNALASSVDGVGGYSFTLVDADTVRNLAVTDTSLLPYKELNPAKDIPWNMKKINAETLQGILQGESMDKISKRILSVQKMNEEAAIRSARTIVTNAECKGRQDSYQRAKDDGIILRKYWLATYDKRARDWHKEAGNKYNEDNAIEIDEFFVVDGEDMLHPGDSEHGAGGHNIYNCRCSIASKVIGFKKVQVQKAMAENQAEEQPTTQAKTKAEAETIAKRFGVDADYSNYDISVANAINRTMQRTVDEFGPHALDALKSIGTDAKGKSRAGGFDEFSGKLSLSGTKGKDALFKMGEKTRKANERYQKMGMRYFSAEDDMSTIHHEFGHIIHVSVGGSTTSTAATALDKEIIAFMRDKNTKVVSELSYYASINHNELISECVAQYMAGNPSEIALGVVEILKKHGLRKR